VGNESQLERAAPPESKIPDELAQRPEIRVLCHFLHHYGDAGIGDLERGEFAAFDYAQTAEQQAEVLLRLIFACRPDPKRYFNDETRDSVVSGVDGTNRGDEFLESFPCCQRRLT
jgi:hypothetical protein